MRWPYSLFSHRTHDSCATIRIYACHTHSSLKSCHSELLFISRFEQAQGQDFRHFCITPYINYTCSSLFKINPKKNYGLTNLSCPVTRARRPMVCRFSFLLGMAWDLINKTAAATPSDSTTATCREWIDHERFCAGRPGIFVFLWWWFLVSGKVSFRPFYVCYYQSDWARDVSLLITYL